MNDDVDTVEMSFDMVYEDDTWEQQALTEARQKFKVMNNLIRLAGDGRAIAYVDVEVGNASRIVVVATPLPSGTHEGGPVLVTLLWPFQTAKVMQWNGDLHASYVAEHFANPVRRASQTPWHPGDLYGVTRAIRIALGRE
jgi:hypothetical protein